MKEIAVSFSGGRTSAYMTRKIQINPIAEKQHRQYIDDSGKRYDYVSFGVDINKDGESHFMTMVPSKAVMDRLKNKDTREKSL